MAEKSKKVGHRDDIHQVMSEIFATHPEVTPGKMFGFPAFYTNKKLFACVYDEGISMKLPKGKIEELNQDPKFIDSIHPFTPYGRHTMKEWIYVVFDDAEKYGELADLYEVSIAFVQEQASKKPKKKKK